jgi:hypothetical protein
MAIKYYFYAVNSCINECKMIINTIIGLKLIISTSVGDYSKAGD